jgi:tetratricopeptide (TPR) repeat protein
MNEKKNLTTKETFELAVQNHQKNNLQVAHNLYKEILKKNPNHFGSIFYLGTLFVQTKRFELAKPLLQKAIHINPNYAEAHNNFGRILRELGELHKAKSCYEKAIQINPNYVDAHNNLGSILQELGVLHKAKSCYEKAIQINPNYSDAYWNLHSLASDIDAALTILKKLYDFDKKFIKAKIMICALKGFKGKFNDFDVLITSPESNHPYTRSIKWVFSLPQLPKIFFNRWNFFDAVVELADKSRPFYEFGVWNGNSFQYLINTLKKGFGFDTFIGLPESWDNVAKGSYSSYGSLPKIEGGEFIVGNFENTLPKFFSEKRPLASLINFDADLYSSTLCALNYSNKVIDEKSILIFDEFLMNDEWEKDEYKALNEFCKKFSFAYEVLAVSFFSKQVAVRLRKN